MLLLSRRRYMTIGGIDISAALVTATTQTYSGSAKTPIPTVTLNGSIIDSVNYTVTYSNNVNAGTANIVITGKGDYFGTARGVFTINKANRTLSFPYLTTVVAPGSTVTSKAIPSVTEGNESVVYSSGTTGKATVNSTTGAVTGVAEGTSIITATLPASTNYNSVTASYTITVFDTIKNFAYTGSVQSVSLPPSIYKLQVWGAQGGSNAAASSYGITAKAGGKGGYSVGIVKIANSTTLYAFVGGQGASSGDGGWNGGGGSGNGSSTYSSGDTYGTSRMGCGGGATDIALVTSGMSYSSNRTNRTSESLLSRMIVAGGGSGGAMSYKRVGTSSSRSVTISASKSNKYISSSGSVVSDDYYNITAPISMSAGEVLTASIVSGVGICVLATTNSSGSSYTPITTVSSYGKHSISYTATSATYVAICYLASGTANANKYKLCIESKLTSRNDISTSTIENPEWTKVFVDADNKILAGFKADGSYIEYITYTNYGSSTASISSSSTSESTDSQVGYVGGGVSGGGYSATYQGRQTAAGTNGAFGLGANQTTTNYRYCSGAGGGGWYGGGSNKNDSTITYTRYSGGGSGWVNTADNSASRPAGYTGLELDQGTTYAGNTTFDSTSGGAETGHAGNGYARITRLSPLDAIAEIVSDKFNPSNVDYSEVTSPEWQHVLLDSEERILAGIRIDGTLFISDYVQNL